MYLTRVHTVAMFVGKHWAHGWEETEANQSHGQSWNEKLSGLRQGGKSWGRQAGEEQEEEERFFDSVTKILLKGKKLWYTVL